MELLAGVVAVLFERLTSLVWRHAARFGPVARLLPLPVRVVLEPSITYASDAGVVLAAPAESIAQLHGTAAVRDLLASPLAALLADTPFVLRVENTSGRYIRLQEIHLSVKLWWPEDRSTSGMGVVSATTIQAGGRGSEGHFGIAFRGPPPLEIPVLRTGAAEAGRSDRGLTLSPEQHGEVALDFAPATPGRYTIGVEVEFNVRGISKRKRLQDLRILHVNDFEWIGAAVSTFEWTKPRRIEQGELDYRLRRILQLRNEPDWREIRATRRVMVRGELEMRSRDP